MSAAVVWYLVSYSLSLAAGTAEHHPIWYEISCVKAADNELGQADSEWWRPKLACVSAPFVSLLAPLSAAANLWLADKQLFDYGTAGSLLVYIVALDDGTNSDSGSYLKVRQGSKHSDTEECFHPLCFYLVSLDSHRLLENDFSQVSINFKWGHASLDINEVSLYPVQPPSMDVAVVLALSNDFRTFLLPEKIKILEENQVISHFVGRRCWKDHI